MSTISSSLPSRDAREILNKATKPEALVFERAAINKLCELCHGISVARGWWSGPNAKRSFGELIALVHSELSEALEGDRKNLPTDKPLQTDSTPFTMVEEELSDALIRIFDLAGAMNLRLGAAFTAKLVYNIARMDHDPKVRAAEGGKKY